MIVIIDNYDSFSYSLYHLMGSLNANIIVVKNHEKTLTDLISLKPTHIIISSGSKEHFEAALSVDAISYFKDKCPILGVSLGHQIICKFFGGAVCYADKFMQGKSSNIHIANGSRLFHGLPPIIQVGRYHSLTVNRDSLPDELLIIGEDDQDEIMAVKHRDYEIYGVQFHPESILTPSGEIIIKNFLSIGGKGSYD